MTIGLIKKKQDQLINSTNYQAKKNIIMFNS